MANGPNKTNSPSNMLKLRMSMVAVLCWLAGASSALAAQSPEEIVAGFDKRVEAMFRTESGKPLVRAEKQKPLGPGRGNYVRAYSYSMVGFAARCLYLNEMLDEAKPRSPKTLSIISITRRTSMTATASTGTRMLLCGL